MFFTVFWAFAKRLYGVGVLVLIGGAFLGFVSWYAGDLSAAGKETARSVEHLTDLAGWAIAVVLAVNGNELRERRLTRLGHVLLAEVAAESCSEALSSSTVTSAVKVS